MFFTEDPFDFITSDLHLGHVNAVKFRPAFTSLDEMNETIIARWNETVGPEDRVLILGDAVLGHRAETLPLLGRLNGEKALVPGNHDHVHPMFPSHRDRWLAEYERYVTVLPAEIVVEGILCSHFPYTRDHTEEIRFPQWRPTDSGGSLFHGHLHSATPMDESRPRQIDVGVDAWDFRPVPIDVLLALSQRQQ